MTTLCVGGERGQRLRARPIGPQPLPGDRVPGCLVRGDLQRFCAVIGPRPHHKKPPNDDDPSNGTRRCFAGHLGGCVLAGDRASMQCNLCAACYWLDPPCANLSLSFPSSHVRSKYIHTVLTVQGPKVPMQARMQTKRERGWRMLANSPSDGAQRQYYPEDRPPDSDGSGFFFFFFLNYLTLCPQRQHISSITRCTSRRVSSCNPSGANASNRGGIEGRPTYQGGRFWGCPPSHAHRTTDLPPVGSSIYRPTDTPS